MAKAYVENIKGIPTMVIDGKPYYGSAVTIANNRNGELVLDEEYLRNLGKSGVRVFFLVCDTNFTRPNAYEMFKKEAETIIRAVPDAYIIPRVGLQPTKEWTDAHPDAMIEFSDGVKRDAYLRSETYNEYIGPYSLSSEEWRKDAGIALIDFCRQAQNESFGDRIIGYFICAGSTSEWHPSMRGITLLNLHMEDGVYFDTSDAFKKEFQSYLDEKYGENAPKAVIPDIDEQYYLMHFDEDVKNTSGGRSYQPAPLAPLKGNCHGSFPNPENAENVTDFYMAWGDATAKSILYFAGLVKEKWPDKLTGAFYAYTRWAQMNSGLSGTNRILKDNRLDFCAAPQDYQNRQPGGWEALRSPTDSFRVNNMLYFAEDDTRTHRENLFYRRGYGVYDELDTENIMKRNFGKNLCCVNYGWWFDQHHGGGRYNSKVCFDVMKKQAEIANLVASGRYKDNEIAFVYDIESYMAVSHNSTQDSITTMKNFSLGKIGAPYDEYILEDFENENMKDYKLYIFAAACMMSNKKIELIKKKLQKNHATALWLYGSGYINKDGDSVLSCENIKSLTGFEVNELCDYVYDANFRICGNEPVTEKLQPRHLYGKIDVLTPCNNNLNSAEATSYLCPLFYVDENETGIFARYCEGGRAAAAVKEYDGFTSVWCGAKFVQYDFVRAVASEAGCHIYSMDGDVIYEGSGYLTVHATSSGEKTVRLKKKCSPFEVYEEKQYGDNVETLKLNMYEGETKMFRLD